MKRLGKTPDSAEASLATLCELIDMARAIAKELPAGLTQTELAQALALSDVCAKRLAAERSAERSAERKRPLRRA